jgi:hypothetical protein
MLQPLCFVVMPFGRKTDLSGRSVDFDNVYQNVIAPAIHAAELEPLRADEEIAGGIIHKPMFERLILCEYAVADLTTANANVFYELGVRHAVRPWSTTLIFAEDTRLPFDVALLRAMPYKIQPDGTPLHADEIRDRLTKLLIETKRTAKDTPDSPIYQLVENYPDIDHTKTDVFRERVQYSAAAKKKLADARKGGVDALREAEKELGPLENIESGVVIDLFLSYRAVKAWTEMIELAKRIPKPLSETVMVQEQLALALNRAGQGEEGERILKQVLERHGPSSETYGILGRVYKDRWEQALKNKEEFVARGLLRKAVESYKRGFEADWRDAYPGVNAVTLMELSDPPDPERLKLIHVVAYAVERKIARGTPDYWDHATLVELAVLAKDQERAMVSAENALAAVRESWEPETTARNLRLIREARDRRGDSVAWAKDIEDALIAKQGK